MSKNIRRLFASILLGTILTYTMPIMAYTNDENVYTKMDSNGKPYKVIVTTTEKDEEGKDQNVEKEVDKELPFECNVSYKLDGKEISPDQLAGKSGKVTIKMEFKNKLENMVNVNGRNEKMYTPMLAIAGTIIDNENNKNIEVTKGKVIDDGNRSIVLGIALPGMEESLKLPDDIDVDIPSTIEIKMDTKNFELGNIMTYTTTKLFDKTIDLDKELDDLYSSINELQDAANKLEDGTNKLKDGSSRLNDGASELDNGVGTLVNGVNNLKDGTSKLNNGAKTLNDGAGVLKNGTTQLKDGAQALEAGTTQIQTGAENLKNGTSQLKAGANSLEDGISQLDSGVNSAYSGAQKVNAGAGSLSQGASDLSSGAKNLADSISGLGENVASAARGVKSLSDNASILAQSASDIKDLAESYNRKTVTAQVDVRGIISQIDGIKASISTAIGGIKSANDSLNTSKQVIEESGGDPSRIQEAIESNNANIETLNGYAAQLDSYKAAISASASNSETFDITAVVNGLEQLSSKLQELSAGASNASNGLSQIQVGVQGALLQGANKVSEGASGLQEGASSLADGTKDLESGLNTLSEGSKEAVEGSKSLSAGITQTDSGAQALSTGINQVSTGAKSLSTGAKQLNDSVEKQVVPGVKALSDGTNELDKGASSLQDGVNKLKNGTGELSNGTRELYNGTVELADGMSKFNTDGIKKISNKVNGDLKKVTNRMEKLQELGNEFNTFASEEEREAIKFISIIDSIKNSSKEETNEEIIINTDDNEKVVKSDVKEDNE